MARSITLVGTSASLAVKGPPATKEELEVYWASKVTGPAGESVTRRTSAPLMVSMAGQSLEDSRMGHWCAWFANWVKTTFGRDHVLRIKEVNFSSNKLSAKGVQQLLSTLQQLTARVGVLKLFQNELQKADDVLDFIVFCEGCLRELHLSHNRLDTVAVRDVIVTTAAANTASGGYAYPRDGSVPLWLRLEGNRFEPKELARLLRPALQQIGRPYEKSICEVDGKSKCCPSSCDQFRTTPPPVHLTYLNLCGHCKNRNTLPASIGRVPSLPKAAVRAATAVAKASASAAASKAAPAAAKSAPTSAPKAWTGAASGKAAQATASPVTEASPPDLLADFKAVTAEQAPALTAVLRSAALEGALPPPPGLTLQDDDTPKSNIATESTPTAPKEDKSFSLQDDFPALPGATKGSGYSNIKKLAATPANVKKTVAAPAAGNWGAKSPSAKADSSGFQFSKDATEFVPEASKPQEQAPAVAEPTSVSAMGDNDFPALPSSGPKVRKAKASSKKDRPATEKVPKQSSLEPQEVPSLSRVSTSASTGDDEHESEAEIHPCDAEACQSNCKACSEEDNGWSKWTVFEGYEAEAPGYLSVSRFEQLKVFQVGSPSEGDANCGWRAYVFGQSLRSGSQGWMPLDILAVPYVTDEGRKWLFVPSTEQCRWEDE